MWDRNPQKDLFQGNYSTCCIGMGEVNAEAMPVYLMNTAFNMIELVDNTTGNTIGNALCYLTTDKYGCPEFMIDNIEIRNSKKPSKKTGIELRNAIIRYAQNVCKNLNGEGMVIWLGDSYNDIPTNPDSKAVTHNSTFVGDVSNVDSVYIDAFGGWNQTDYLSDTIYLHRMDTKIN